MHTFAESNLVGENEFAQAYPTLLRYCRHLTAKHANSMNDAEDLAQNAAAKGWEKRHQFQDQSKLSSWLCCIAHNLYITERRCRQSQWNQRMLSLTDDFGRSHDHPTTSTDPTSPLTSQQIRNSIAVTHPQYLTTLDLALHGLSYPEIAKQLGLAYPAVRSRVHRMHLILREQYKNRAQG